MMISRERVEELIEQDKSVFLLSIYNSIEKQAKDFPKCILCNWDKYKDDYYETKEQVEKVKEEFEN